VEPSEEPLNGGGHAAGKTEIQLPSTGKRSIDISLSAVVVPIGKFWLNFLVKKLKGVVIRDSYGT